MAYTTTLDSTNQADLYAVRDQAYFTNDFDPMRAIRVQSGTDYAAGITGPAYTTGAPLVSSAGVCTLGQHYIRYRYRDSRTGYVSNPSNLRSQTITSTSTKLVFAVSSTTAVIFSTDERVNEILFEMTLVESGEFYVATTVANTAAEVEISSSDGTLVAQTSVSLNWGGVDDRDSWSHNAPPLAAFGLEHKGRHFVGGKYDRTYQALVSSTSAVVTITTSQAFSTAYSDRFLWFPDADLVKDISSVDSATQITMAEVYGAATGTVTAVVTAFEPNMLYWTLPLYMESFDTTRNLRRVLEGRRDVLRGAASYQGDLILFGRSCAEALIYTVNPAPPDGYTVPIPGRRGVLNQRCHVEGLGNLYCWDRRGVWTLAGRGVEHLSDPVQDIVDGVIDYDYDHLFHAAFDPVTQCALFFFVTTGDTTAKYALVYDVRRSKWSVSSWQQAITATTVCVKPDGSVILMLFDSNGYVWEYGSDDYRDGVLGTQSVATFNSGCAVDSLVFNETYVASELIGVYVYLPDTAETVRIVSNTPTTALISSSLASAPDAGGYAYLGVAPATYEFKWEIGESGAIKKRPIYFLIDQIPSDDGFGRVYFYADGSDTAGTYSLSALDSAPDGVRMVDGLTYAEFSLANPHVSVPVPLDYQRSIKATISVVRPDGELRILSARFASEEESYVGE
jgi:hypothetical protein